MNSKGRRVRLLQELIEDDTILDMTPILQEAVRVYPGLRNKRGGKVRSKVKGAGKFFRNPLIAGTAAVMALSAYDKYKKNKRYTTRFYAKTPSEKKMYKEIVQMMTSSGKYKLKRTQYVSGGRMWTLKRVGR